MLFAAASGAAQAADEWNVSANALALEAALEAAPRCSRRHTHPPPRTPQGTSRASGRRRLSGGATVLRNNVCPAGWQHFAGKCWHRIGTTMDHPSAEEACRKADPLGLATLAVFDTWTALETHRTSATGAAAMVNDEQYWSGLKFDPDTDSECFTP